MVAGAEQALEHQIQSRRGSGGEHHMGGVVKAEQAAQPLPQGEGDQLRRLGRGVGGAVDGGSHLLHILGHASGHPGRLGKGCGGVVQIDHGVHLSRMYGPPS